jgi:hypothetical protein
MLRLAATGFLAGLFGAAGFFSKLLIEEEIIRRVHRSAAQAASKK